MPCFFFHVNAYEEIFPGLSARVFNDFNFYKKHFKDIKKGCAFDVCLEQKIVMNPYRPNKIRANINGKEDVFYIYDFFSANKPSLFDKYQFIVDKTGNVWMILAKRIHFSSKKILIGGCNEEMDLLVKTLQEETDKLSFDFLIPFDFYRVSQFDLEKHIVRVSCPMVYNQLFAFAIIKKEFDYPKSMLIY